MSDIRAEGEAAIQAVLAHATWVFEKRDGRWLTAAYHNSPVCA